VGKPRIRWKNVVRRDISHILEIRGWRRRAEDREEWLRLLTGDQDQDPEVAVAKKMDGWRQGSKVGRVGYVARYK